MSGVSCWRRAAHQSVINTNWSPFCGQQQLIPTMPEYQKGERAFPYASPAAWNQLPENIHQLQTTSFKHKLKTFLFVECYNSADWLFFLLFIHFSFLDDVMHLCPWPHCNGALQILWWWWRWWWQQNTVAIIQLCSLAKCTHFCNSKI